MDAALAPGPCARCLRKPPPFDRSAHLFRYAGPVRTAILQWKLGGHPAGIAWLLDAAAERLREIVSCRDLLLPVPMPLSRMRRSGLHHAADLARRMAAHAGCGWDWRILRRIGEQPQQSGLSARQRRQNLRHAFAVDRQYWEHARLQPARIWIVDDVRTTGATLHAAAEAASRLQRPLGVLSLARA